MNAIKKHKLYRAFMLGLGLMGAYAGYKTIRVGARQAGKGVKRAKESLRG